MEIRKEKTNNPRVKVEIKLPNCILKISNFISQHLTKKGITKINERIDNMQLTVQSTS